MVAHVLRLRFDLLVGALRGDGRHRARLIVGAIVIVAALAAVVVGAGRLHGASDLVAQTVTVVAGSALVLGFFAAALVGGADDQLDPRRFAILGASPAPIAGAILLASILSVPVLALVVAAVAIGGVWIAHGAPLAAVVAAGVLGVLTCLLASRVALAIGGLLLRERRSRELSGVFVVALLVVIVPVAVFFASLGGEGAVTPELRTAVAVLSLTPLGAAWAIPGAAVDGSVGGPLIVAVVTVAALGALWFRLARALMTTTERPGSGRERAGLGWFALTPSTPAGGTAARSLVYWLRDPRYLMNLVVVPVAAVVVVVPLLVVGVPMAYIALIPAPLMALFFGWLAHNDLAYDSTALWMHVASAMRGTSDRIGRLVPVTLLGVATLAVAVPIAISLHGRWAVLPALAGVCASLFLSGLGLSSIASAAAPYAASRPGDSPFQQPQRTSGGLAQASVLLGALVLSVPALWWGWLALAVDAGYAWAALWTGLAVGVVVLVAGILVGGRVFDRRGGRLMEFVESI